MVNNIENYEKANALNVVQTIENTYKINKVITNYFTEYLQVIHRS